MIEEEAGRKHPVHPTPAHERFNAPIIVFVIVWTKDRELLLANAETQALLRDAWDAADALLVGRYVIMPDHLHLSV